MDYKANALYNQNTYNNLTKNEKDIFIEKVYKYYNNSLPLVKYDIDTIKKQFEMLKSNQHFKIDKHIIVDVDYKKNYIDYCSLSDYYQNKERMSCKNKNRLSPYEYYKKNYKNVLNKYFSNMYKHYEDGLVIDKLDFNVIKDNVNPIYLQNIIYEDNKYCTVFKPYLFKLLINTFRNNKKVNILDLSSGWGDRLISSLSIQNNIHLYVGIDPNEKLFDGYKKMISDLAKKKNKEKFILINKPAQDVEYNDLPYFDIIFWSPPFFDQELYVNDETRPDYKNQSLQSFSSYEDWEDNFMIYTINKSTNNLKQNGYLILYLGNMNYKTFISKMNNITKLKYIYDLQIKTGDKFKNYMIYKKIEPENICKVITKGNEKMIKNIKEKINMPANPKLKIIPINVDNKIFNVIQDGVLMTGTKQRVVSYFLEKVLKPSIDTLVYAGSYNGFGAIATAYGAYKLGLKSKVFLTSPENKDYLTNSRQINTLLALNADIYVCSSYRNARNMEYDFSNIITEKTNEWKTKKNYYVVPMGLNDDDGIMVNILSRQLVGASQDTILKNSSNTNIWLVAGSGGIAQSLHLAFPNSNIYIYLTGSGKYKEKVIDWAKKNTKITIVNDMDVTDVKNDCDKYYNTVKNYDDQIFTYVKKYGKSGDFIWNVASDQIDW